MSIEKPRMPGGYPRLQNSQNRERQDAKGIKTDGQLVHSTKIRLALWGPLMMFTWTRLSGRTDFTEAPKSQWTHCWQYPVQRGQESKGFTEDLRQIRGTQGARRPSDWVKATRAQMTPYRKTKTTWLTLWRYPALNTTPPFLECTNC